jgi:tRNA pseudouridine13 synthase
MNPKRIFLQSHQPIKFTFKQNRYDFIVEELPIKFSNSGNFMVLKIQKEYTSTWDLIHHISNKLNIKQNTIGYAGLKDKNSTSIQYISIPIGKSRDFKDINSKLIKVLQTYQHNKQLQLGDLVANRFSITLKDVEQDDIVQIYRAISQIQKNGMPNYFGYQRFGEDTTFQKCKELVYGELSYPDKKLERLLINAYQSYFFNAWLNKRILLSKERNKNKLLQLDGDILNNNIITGLLPGRKVKRATKEAREIEKEFDDMFMHQKGSRRDAWIFPKNISNKYIEDKKWLVLNFDMPKSSYATVFIENIANQNLKRQ